MGKVQGAGVRVSLLCALLGYAAGAQAQQVTAVTLPAGFQPDPLVFQGRGGGDVQASSVNNSCRGYIPMLPQHTLVVQSPLPFLRFLVAGDGVDGTLVVRGPRGDIFCADDVNGSIDPVVDLARIPPGRYDVFVGAYSNSNNGFPYRFAVTESQAVMPSNLPAGGGAVVPPPPSYGNPPPPAPPGPRGGDPLSAAGLNPNGNPSVGRISLNGPLNQPRRERGHGGGSVDGSSVRGDGPCRGYFTAEPSVVLEVRRSLPLLRMWVNSGADTTLIVQGPDNVVRCSDDEGGDRNPLLDFNRTPTGLFRVWVGTYRPNMTGVWQITLTSNPSQRP